MNAFGQFPPGQFVSFQELNHIQFNMNSLQRENLDLAIINSSLRKQVEDLNARKHLANSVPENHLMDGNNGKARS